ncbi:hypothetical protein V757_02295 [Pelistega indica]|uniref:Uncharacterized protein n=1 Tax=Pelistega indica TaxID=1414851 RepID=V8G8D1_9BURK|nr:hypothetical protein [Pelistega indica]ETD72789.1 hypothetical protein V757_02295 [Pelistega indica]
MKVSKISITVTETVDNGDMVEKLRLKFSDDYGNDLFVKDVFLGGIETTSYSIDRIMQAVNELLEDDGYDPIAVTFTEPQTQQLN